MAQLSIIPGRLRVESPLLVGRPEVCAALDLRLMAHCGVKEASSNPRTGRVLVRFDEGAVEGDELLGRIAGLINGFSRGRAVFAQPPLRRRKDGAVTGLPSQIASHLLWDVVAHALLPSPLDLLLPTAVAVMRR